MLQEQGRVTEILDAEQRIAAIAKDYAAQPENTIIVSPDNASRRALNQGSAAGIAGSWAIGKGRSLDPRPRSAF